MNCDCCGEDIFKQEIKLAANPQTEPWYSQHAFNTWKFVNLCISCYEDLELK